MSEDVWILGIHMTKFGKHPDKDTIDLASEAVMGALADGGVTMKDIGVLGAGNLMGGGGIGQPLQKQIGQTGIPVYNVANACATGATALRVAIMAVKAGEVDMGLAVGVEKLAGAGLLAGGSRAADAKPGPPVGATARWRRSTGGSAHRPCRACSPRSAWSTATSTAGRTSSCSPSISEKNHAHSTLNPLASYQKRMSLDEIMNDVMIAYPNTRPMCSANCDGAAAAVVVSRLQARRRSRSSSSAGRSRSRPRSSRPTRGRRRARSCPT